MGWCVIGLKPVIPTHDGTGLEANIKNILCIKPVILLVFSGQLYVIMHSHVLININQ